jgi:hypothetical protein
MDPAAHAVLQWDRGALELECERSTTVQAGVEAYLGRSVFATDGDVIVQVSLSRVIEADGGHVVAKVVERRPDGSATGERTVSGDSSCASLDEPLTLVVALLLDRAVAPRPAEPLEAEPPPAPPPHEPPPEPSGEIQTAPSLERATTRRGHFALLGLGFVSMGAMPSAGLGLGLLFSVKPRKFWGFGLEAVAARSGRAQLGAGSLDASWAGLSGSLCPLQGTDNATWWSACGTLGVARLQVSSSGFVESRSHVDWLAVPGLSARAGWLAGRGCLLGGGLQALFPVSPDRYVYRDAAGMKLSAFEPNRLVIAAHLGFGVLVE